MAWWILVAVVACWAAVGACWLIRAGMYRDREQHARMLRRTIPGAGREPEAIRAARDAFGGGR